MGLAYFTQYADQGEQLGDETWVNRAIPVTRILCLMWKHPLSPNPLVTEIQSNAFVKEVIETVFWDQKYVLHVDLLDSADISYCDATG